MRERIIPFVVIALNNESAEQDMAIFAEYDIPFKHVNGVYKGEKENAYVIPLPHDGERQDFLLAVLRSLAMGYNQECILRVHPDGSAYLVNTDKCRVSRYGKETYIGQWQEVSRHHAETIDGYTYDPETGRYFAAL